MLVDVLENSVVAVDVFEEVFVLTYVLQDAVAVVDAFEDCRVR